MYRIHYENFDKAIPYDQNSSILETSLAHNIPHAHACGGNAICSSCRIRVINGLGNICQRNQKEQALARRLGFTDDIRLACQAKLVGDVVVKLPVLDEIDLHIVSNRSNDAGISSVGEERELSFLFADAEGFTQFTESTPAYDVVHVLNRYYYVVGQLVKEHHGFIVDYFGDGFLAVFGVEKPNSHALDAVKTGLTISDEMKKLNDYVESLLEKKFKLRVGVHSDNVILGSIGLDGMKKLSVIGDGVNFASRIEQANKELGTYFLISRNTYDLTKSSIEIADMHVIQVKGKSGIHQVFQVASVRKSTEQETEEACISKVENYISEVIPLAYISRFLRLVFHDVADYNPLTGQGGLNASVLHEENLAKEPNQFVSDSMISFLDVLKVRFPSISKADLLAIIGAVGIQKLGGPKISVGLGRIDYSSLHETGDMVEKTDSAMQLKSKFSALGLSHKELVVLSGAHTLNKWSHPSTSDPFNFSNSYFKTLLNTSAPTHKNLIHTDLQLLSDEQLLNYVQEYANDEQRFHADFAKAYQKLTLIGHDKKNIRELQDYVERH